MNPISKLIHVIWLWVILVAAACGPCATFAYDYHDEIKPNYDGYHESAITYDGIPAHINGEEKDGTTEERLLFASSSDFLAAETALTKGQRLNMVYDGVTSAPAATTAQEAMQQMHSTLDAVEDAYSGVPKNPNPGLASDGRMYPVQADRMVTGADGSITATSRGHVTTYGPNGSITVTDRATGAVVYSKPGGG